MIPSFFVALTAMPLTPNGKVDLKALPEPAASKAGRRQTPPRTDVERQLAQLWSEALGVSPVGVHDNFFELGGDSILSLKVSSRARRLGFELTPRELFEHPTVAELAGRLARRMPPVAAGATAGGDVPLTPIQRWFFSHEFAEPQHWNQALVLEAPAGLDASRLRRALAVLLDHHDALRLRFSRGETGWRQSCVGPGEAPALANLDLGGLPAPARARAWLAAATLVGTGLDLARGPLLRCAYVGLGAGSPPRLLLVAHHLAVDGVSWRILVEDLMEVYRRLGEGATCRLPAATPSFQNWARSLEEYARSAALREEEPYWSDLLERASGAGRMLPQALGGESSEASAGAFAVGLNRKETASLLRELPRAYRANLEDALLSALLRGMAVWTGRRDLFVDLEGHGRQPVVEGVDPSRTVGWFTSLYPVLLHLPAGEDGEAEEVAALLAVKEQLRQVPNRGLGFGLLESRRGRDAGPRPEISFNYLGQLDVGGAADDLLRLADAPTGPARSPRALRPHPLEVVAAVSDGRLRFELRFSDHANGRSGIEELGRLMEQALAKLVEHCTALPAARVTASDFPFSGLLEAELLDVLGEVET
jgi:non-ribosomal peptide synthase protein (TIGR01720 family)